MKHLCLLLLCIFTYSMTNAKIWRVNNIAGINADYSTAQAAHDAANVGDTIHLETSSTSYGFVTASKQLVWIGNGYFVDGTKASYMGGIQFGSGSANSVVTGIYFTSYVYVNSNNITVNRCYVPLLYFFTNSINQTHDFAMTQSFVANVSYTTSGSNASTGYTFTNNVFTSSFELPTNFTSVVLIHNYINNLHSSTVAFIAYNNIFYNVSSNQQICTYAINVYNNLFMYYNNTLYTGTNGNIFVNSTPTSTNSVFTGSLSNSNDTWLTLKSGSPAIGAGLGGVDIGPLGGSSKYRMSGIPPVPYFTQFQFQSTPVNTLPVIISTRSNN